ncbi:adenylate/guanylate cyclase domain-containing protein [Oligoflexus tunisiensis]|uniref:adenylate/guanylate cyclase domain-containing protein n=1 Tax=Oligoflexus tunisiensis TaxID=708132 RepID=UPI000AF607DF|nr:adenylate/guanylate cyclase domain-containing protein [Oligoflexus tunisiensis]
MFRDWSRLKNTVLKSAELFIPDHSDKDERSEYIRSVVILFCGSAIAFSYLPLYYFWSHPISRYGMAGASLMLLSFITCLYWTRRGHIVIANFQAIMTSFINLLLSGIAFGKAMNFHLYLPLLACGVIIIHPKRYRWLAVVYGVIGCVLLIGMELYLPDRPIVGPALDRTFTNIFTMQVLISTYATVMVFIGWFLIHSERIASALAQEKARSEALLLNILPGSIAQRLMDSNEEIADGFESVTVLFADIVNFSDISHRLAPRELVNYLNEIFTKFDQLTHEHGLEKIKTIGDAYMVAGGIPHARPDHAEAVMNLAIAMLTYIEKSVTPTGGPLMIRIGINSGPVIAGVIGLKKFIYDLWGDTVNLASRMESHGLVNQIQISDATYQLIKGKFPLIERGSISLKGVGHTRTWLYRLPSSEESKGLPQVS